MWILAIVSAIGVIVSVNLLFGPTDDSQFTQSRETNAVQRRSQRTLGGRR